MGTQAHEVGALAGLVAQRMGLSQEDIQRAVQAGELRDVGRVAIPDAILNKPAEELDEEERAFLRSQSTISERIIAAAPALAQIARLVRSTGEQFDGSGYPDGLRGDDIPLVSRIVAACHSYVVRVHQSNSTSDPAVIRHILSAVGREAGTRLDPGVVDVLIAVVTDQDTRVTAGCGA
jgi:two-component system cell cycle response regulator